MSKYDYLEEFLSERVQESLRLTFSELEEGTGFPISPVYLKSAEIIFGESSRYKTYANKAGCVIEDFNLDEEFIVFTRVSNGPIHQGTYSHKTEWGPATANQPTSLIGTIGGNAKNNSTRLVFLPRTLTDAEAFAFFVYSYHYYCELLEGHRKDPLLSGISLPSGKSLESLYLSPTDRWFLDPYGTLSPNQFIFKEFVCHALNKGNGKSFAVYESNIKVYLHDYDTAAYLHSISPSAPAEITKIDSQLDCGRAFASELYELVKPIASYLNGKSLATLHAAVKRDFDCFVEPGKYQLRVDYNGIVQKFRNLGLRGFGEALSFDFLKEFDLDFDLPKPDRHVKRTLIALLNDDRSFHLKKRGMARNAMGYDYNSIPTIHQMKPNAMGEFLSLMKQINREFERRAGKKYKRIPNYFLDKFIYLICSGRLYLHDLQKNDAKLKSKYLQGVFDDSFKKEKTRPNDIRNILNLIP